MHVTFGRCGYDSGHFTRITRTEKITTIYVDVANQRGRRGNAGHLSGGASKMSRIVWRLRPSDRALGRTIGVVRPCIPRSGRAVQEGSQHDLAHA